MRRQKVRQQVILIDMPAFRRASEAYYKRYHKAMIRLWKAGIRRFISEVVTTMAVGEHIDTGMSAGSLLPLAREVSGPRIDGVRGTTILTRQFIISRRERAKRKGVTSLAGAYDSSGFRTIKEGERLGKDAAHVSYGSVGQPILDFSFDIKVFQYSFHEPDWQTLRIGEDAFKDFIGENYLDAIPKGMPGVDDFSHYKVVWS